MYNLLFFYELFPLNFKTLLNKNSTLCPSVYVKLKNINFKLYVKKKLPLSLRPLIFLKYQIPAFNHTISYFNFWHRVLYAPYCPIYVRKYY